MFSRGKHKKGDPVPEVNAFAAVGTGLGVVIVSGFALAIVGSALFALAEVIFALFVQWPVQATVGTIGVGVLLIGSYFIGRALLREMKRRDHARRKRYREMIR